VLFNVNGSTQTDYSGGGFNTAGFNQTTGLGTLTFTFNPGAAGTYSFDSFFDLELSTPFYNEFGTASGSTATGQSWEIGDSFASSIYNDVTTGGPLSNSNMLPGGTSNFLNDCTASNCNGDAAMAMGFQFGLTGTQEAVITLNFSTTNPGGTGLVLDQTHPVDPANSTQTDVYFTGSEVTQAATTPPPPPPTVPEPSTFLLVGAGLGGLLLTKMRSR
jgi:hypothetical protein